MSEVGVTQQEQVVASPVPSGDCGDETIWQAHHQVSELFAKQAYDAAARGQHEHAQGLFEKAARSEAEALVKLADGNPAEFGVLAINMVSLWRQAKADNYALRMAHMCLSNAEMLDEHRERLDEVVIDIYRTRLSRMYVRNLHPSAEDAACDQVDLSAIGEDDLISCVQESLSSDPLVSELIRRLSKAKEDIAALNEQVSSLEADLFEARNGDGA